MSGRNNIDGVDVDDEMSEADIARHFKEKTPRKKKQKDLSKMTREEIEAWEKAQDNSNEIYKISARVKNLARSGGASLTPAGEALCNVYTHVIKELYDFAATMRKSKNKDKLLKLIRKNEDMPANFIAGMKNRT